MADRVRKYEHKVQYYETDAMGIAHHANYIHWFEEARTAWLEDAGFGYDKMEKSGVSIPTIGVEASYKSSAKYPEIVEILPKVSFYNGTRVNVVYEVRDKASGELRCTGETRHCFLNTKGRVVSLKRSFPEIHEVFEGLKE